MRRKWIIAFVITAALLLGFSTISFAGEPGTAVYQDASPTATPYAMNGMGSGGAACPMMSGSGSMAGMSGMGAGSMAGMSGTGSMGSMGSSTAMQGMSGMQGMPGMSGSPMYMDDSYFVLTRPTTWFSSNPWMLLGWIIVGLVVVALLTGIGVGIAWIAQRLLGRRKSLTPIPSPLSGPPPQ